MENSKTNTFFTFILESWKIILGGIVTILITAFSSHYVWYKNPREIQGTSNLNLKGRWHYIDNTFSKSSILGGYMDIVEDTIGCISVEGFRKWWYIQDTIGSGCYRSNMTEKDSVLWTSEWIVVKNEKDFAMKYYVVLTGTGIRYDGFATGTISKNAKLIKGNYYVFSKELNSEPIYGEFTYAKQDTIEPYKISKEFRDSICSKPINKKKII
jgi:hypothetical protein